MVFARTRRSSLALLSGSVLSMTAVTGSAQDDMTSLRREVLANPSRALS